MHAEGKTTAAVILMAELYKKPIHVCHVARKEEVRLRVLSSVCFIGCRLCYIHLFKIAIIRVAKEKGLPITCEVSPHHLFLCEDDIPHIGKGRAEVRPVLCSREDQEALWKNLDIIDWFCHRSR